MNLRHHNDHTVAPDFEKIFRCIDSCVLPSQLLCCVAMINTFKVAHPNDEALAYMLHGMILMRTRLLQDRDRTYNGELRVTRKVRYLLTGVNWN